MFYSKIHQSAVLKTKLDVQGTASIKREPWSTWNLTQVNQNFNKCAGNETLQTTWEFVKLSSDKEITEIPGATEDYMQQFSNVNPEHL